MYSTVRHASHVVHGYVGNKCAVFPLQLLGFDVDAVNSVQFSNHTGYPTVRGHKLDGPGLWELVEGLQSNGLLQYTHLLTGYIGSASLLKTIVRLVELLRRQNPELTYVCDPVMGDDGRLYVPEDAAAVYGEAIVPLASVLTPNQFEAERLTGREIRSEGDALAACRALHERGPATVVITSVSLPSARGETLLVASTSLPQADGSWQALKLRIPRVDGYFTGTGDLMTTLLLARLHERPDNLRAAVEAAVAGLQAVLLRTIEAAGDAAHSIEATSEVARLRELRIVQNQHLLRNPEVKLFAEALEPT
ncbi:hypothetical protein WJX81_002662 [Elliptochloris bilobata]|uniref:pyridoxal kinase n=1 Tax=Elliptochloris bilobata TaxID=381761 RepID=A0AAW1SIL1_9CHLO